MTMTGSTTAGTAFIDLDDVRVPVGMVVGDRGKGFKYVVSNFNHEVGAFGLFFVLPISFILFILSVLPPLKNFPTARIANTISSRGFLLGFRRCDVQESV